MQNRLRETVPEKHQEPSLAGGETRLQEEAWFQGTIALCCYCLVAATTAVAEAAEDAGETRSDLRENALDVATRSPARAATRAATRVTTASRTTAAGAATTCIATVAASAGCRLNSNLTFDNLSHHLANLHVHRYGNRNADGACCGVRNGLRGVHGAGFLTSFWHAAGAANRNLGCHVFTNKTGFANGHLDRFANRLVGANLLGHRYAVSDFLANRHRLAHGFTGRLAFANGDRARARAAAWIQEATDAAHDARPEGHFLGNFHGVAHRAAPHFRNHFRRVVRFVHSHGGHHGNTFRNRSGFHHGFGHGSAHGARAAFHDGFRNHAVHGHVAGLRGRHNNRAVSRVALLLLLLLVARACFGYVGRNHNGFTNRLVRDPATAAHCTAAGVHCATARAAIACHNTLHRCWSCRRCNFNYWCWHRCWGRSRCWCRILFVLCGQGRGPEHAGENCRQRTHLNPSYAHRTLHFGFGTVATIARSVPFCSSPRLWFPSCLNYHAP